MVRASCLCGDVVYEAEGEFKHMTHCHCSACRKVHGAPFATYVGVPTEGIRWIGGENGRTRYRSSPGLVRAFCSTCGSVVPTPEKGGPLTFVPAGNLEADCGARPEVHIFTGSKAAWYTITDELPQCEAYPPGYDIQPVERAPRGGGGDGAASGSL